MCFVCKSRYHDSKSAAVAGARFLLNKGRVPGLNVARKSGPRLAESFCVQRPTPLELRCKAPWAMASYVSAETPHCKSLFELPEYSHEGQTLDVPVKMVSAIG